ncbi:MAG: VOC family protein [Pseudomonadota bacterium]
MTIFHLAFNVPDLDDARRFYGGLLGCREVRATDERIDFDLFGHQISLHLDAPVVRGPARGVGRRVVPMPHFSVRLSVADWEVLAERLEIADTRFVTPPTLRAQGESVEQATMFFLDPFGNPIEIKGMRQLDRAVAS